MKATKKPVTINCWLITQEELDYIWNKAAIGMPGLLEFGSNLHGANVWIYRERIDEYDKRKGFGKVVSRIKTLEGDMLLDAGNYLLKGVLGEFYPCRADIFKKTYTIVPPKKKSKE